MNRLCIAKSLLQQRTAGLGRIRLSQECPAYLRGGPPHPELAPGNPDHSGGRLIFRLLDPHFFGATTR